MTLHLVRHAHAGARSGWVGDDFERPLSDKGLAQAEAITRRFGDAPVARVLSSAAVRCQQTVAPLARRLGVEVEVHPALTEGARAAETTTLLWELAAAGDEVVLCSHGDVIPAALEALRADGVSVETRGLPKGTLYSLTVEDGAIVAATFEDPRP